MKIIILLVLTKKYSLQPKQQPSIGVLIKVTEKHPYQSEISIKLQSKFTEITLRPGCSPVNLLHISGTPWRAASNDYRFKDSSGLLVNNEARG